MRQDDTTNRGPRQRGQRGRARRGSVLLFTGVALVALLAVTSLAVDYGHVQVVKAEMQRAADDAARGYIDSYTKLGAGYAYQIALATTQYNTVDPNSGVAPTVSVVPGTWDATSKQFTPGSGSVGATAVQVAIGRQAATGNPVQLFWTRVLGRTGCDVHATATCALLGAQSGSVTVPSTASPYLSGMPAGSTTVGYGDNTSNAGAYQMTSVTVIPGTYVTLSNVTGTTSIVPQINNGTGQPYVPYTGPAGDTSLVLHHGQNFNSNPNPGFPNSENGFGDAKMPADALMGVFLTAGAPDPSKVPAAVDWTDAAHANQASYTKLAMQQPFLIGTGSTTGGTVQQFLVPPGATRLYLGVWDGVQYSNNGGSLSGTIKVPPQATMVQAQ